MMVAFNTPGGVKNSTAFCSQENFFPINFLDNSMIYPGSSPLASQLLITSQ